MRVVMVPQHYLSEGYGFVYTKRYTFFFSSRLAAGGDGWSNAAHNVSQHTMGCQVDFIKDTLRSKSVVSGSSITATATE